MKAKRFCLNYWNLHTITDLLKWYKMFSHLYVKQQHGKMGKQANISQPFLLDRIKYNTSMYN